MTLRVIDIETTGIDPNEDAIIEIASVDVYKSPDGYALTSQRETLINPGRAIPPASSAVHHLVDADVQSAPTLAAALEAQHIATADAYVAHNCAFERGFLEPHIGEQVWVCTMKCALRVWPDAPGHSNQVLRYWLGLHDPFGWGRDRLVPHRALSDAVVTAAIFAELTKHAPWKDMVKWSSEPALHTRLTFGKHKGLKFSEAPRDYLDWIINKSDMDADIKFSARHAMQQEAAE